MPLFSILDVIALGFFIVAWVGYAYMTERSRMQPQRPQRAHERLPRDLDAPHARARAAHGRHADHGGAAERHRVLRHDLAVRDRRRADHPAFERRDRPPIAAHLPVGIEASRGLWEAKAIGLTVIFVYAFFKFAWSYRLYNYVAILLGAMPLPAEKDTPEAEAHVLRTAGLFTTAGRHFNRGQRAFFFALGYLGWFAGPMVLIATTTVVVVVMWWRQYKSDSLRAVAGSEASPTQRRCAPG